MLILFAVAVVILLAACTVSFGQSTTYLADNLGVKIEVVSNLVGDTSYFTCKVTLTNDGDQSLAAVSILTSLLKS